MQSRDDSNSVNPLAGDITRIYTEVVSQPGRLLNDFRNLGFNQAENGRKVFDGMMQWIAAGDGISITLQVLRRAAPSAIARITCMSRACSRSPTCRPLIR